MAVARIVVPGDWSAFVASAFKEYGFAPITAFERRDRRPAGAANIVSSLSIKRATPTKTPTSLIPNLHHKVQLRGPSFPDECI
jgi:hypothetical protein